MSTSRPADSRNSSHPTPGQWLEGARPRTWANAFAPVLAGTAAAASAGGLHLGRALLALAVSWALIVGVNYANDYADGIRGTDKDRSGPLRLVGSGLVEPKAVKRAAFLAFGVAAIAGIALSLMSAPWLIAVGAACIAAAWWYTGGKHPYGYRGLGEVSVFVFFGLVAVLGTQYTQLERITWQGGLLAVSVGAMSSAVNLVNNLRDIPTDAASGKITLAVKLGDTRTRTLYLGLLGFPFVATLLLVATTPASLLAFITAPTAWKASKPVRAGAKGADLIPVLGDTGLVMLLWTLLAAVALF